MSHELSLHARLLLSCSWECCLCDSRWRFPKWEIDGEAAYFAHAVGKTPEGDSFWGLWL